MNTQQWVSYALSGSEVWNIGQITPDTKRALNKLAKAGRLQCERARWAGFGPWKTVWFTEGCEPQEVLARRWDEQHHKAT